ncbi:hypothetical protein [Clostridium botulinum]|uniref:hypothetical protein n=1 Tax=Clostridium botulinum TaxID=1491 RepID=UPI001C9AD506|nr:hypothetical protein [Clostridium botulinum]MBY6838828.1 hypothetical protein [Clostridium botulinum]
MPFKKDVDTNYCVMQLSNKCKNKKGILLITDFYNVTNSLIFKNGKMPICKHCFKEYVYVNGEIDVNKLKNLLRICDYPFYNVEFKSALEDKKETLGMYFKNIQLNHGSTNWSSGDIGNTSNINEKGEIIESNFKPTDDIIKFWGKGYTNEEYLFLQEYYHDLIRIYDHSQPVQVNNYRNMAKTQLQANKCLSIGDMGGYDKAMKILSMLSGDSNIKPVQESSSDRVQKGGFDAFIKHIEDDEPIFDWEKDLGHKDDVKSLLNIFFFGHLAKVLNIVNPFKTEYDEEMKSYTVDLNEVEDEKNQIDFLGGEKDDN